VDNFSEAEKKNQIKKVSHAFSCNVTLRQFMHVDKWNIRATDQEFSGEGGDVDNRSQEGCQGLPREGEAQSRCNHHPRRYSIYICPLNSSDPGLDDVFVQLAEEKLDGQKAFMTGKLKVRFRITTTPYL
jgi:hypothetical protein